MLVGIILENDLGKMRVAIDKNAPHADVLEWRLDGLAVRDFNDLKALKKDCPCPVIITLRPVDQGGLYRGTEAARIEELYQLGSIADYLDVEYTVDETVLARIKHANPNVKIIRSFHDFSSTPRDLGALFSSMISAHADQYKFITTANIASDALRLMAFARNKSKHHALTAHAMGQAGAFSRILGPMVGNQFTYGMMPNIGQSDPENTPAPGLISLIALKKLYRTPNITEKTRIYALLGDPVMRSSGHIYHNHCFACEQEDAVYVRIPVREYELMDFFDTAKFLPFHGFSITMPLKETVLSMADQLAANIQTIGAANTLCLSDGHWVADNVDGLGAMDALEAQSGPLKGKNLLLTGAGGTARAIAFEATRRGAHVTIINRTRRSAIMIAGRVGCRTKKLDSANWVEPYDAIVNTLPHTAGGAIDWSERLNRITHAESVIMDVVYKPRISPLLALAQDQGLTIVLGRTMFRNQAKRQQDIWTSAR